MLGPKICRLLSIKQQPRPESVNTNEEESENHSIELALGADQSLASALAGRFYLPITRKLA